MTPTNCLADCIEPALALLPAAMDSLPARPTLTPVTAAQVQCLAPDVYTTLVNRERALRMWGESLEAIIQANNAKAKQ